MIHGLVNSTIPPQLLLAREGSQMVTDVHGDVLLFHETGDDIRDEDIFSLALEDGAEPVAVVSEPGYTALAVFSPDGRWIAYESDETGTVEIWAREFQDAGRKLKVSGGESAFTPVWNEAGIFYNATGDWMLVEDRDPGPGFDPAPARVLRRSIMRRGFGRPNFDVSDDGTRVLIPRALGDESGSEGSTLRVVLNWFDEVERRIPGWR